VFECIFGGIPIYYRLYTGYTLTVVMVALGENA
jgi:hypothetical protein